MASLSDLAGKRVLVTGASGFTGRYMTAELQHQGACVIGAGVRQCGLDGHGAADEFLAMDLRDRDCVARVVAEAQADYVVHLAAMAFVAHGNAEDFYRVNLLGTRNLLEALAGLDAMPERVLVASSANVYGNATEGEIDEAVAPAPANDYAVSKLAMENIAAIWQDRVPLLVTRPFNYTGVGQDESFLIPKIVAHFKRRESRLELGNIDVWRDFGDVRMVVEAYSRLLRCPQAQGLRINVCTGTAHSLRDVVELCSKITGHSVEISVNPAFVRASEVRTLKGSKGLLESLIGPIKAPDLADTLAWMLVP